MANQSGKSGQVDQQGQQDQQIKGPDNTLLLQAMLAVAADDNPDTRRQLYATMLNATFVVPSVQPLKQVKPGEPTNVDLITIVQPDGKVLYPIFTDFDALAAWRPNGCAFFTLHARAYFPIAMQKQAAAVVINPAGPTSGTVLPREIVSLAMATIPDFSDPSIHRQNMLNGAPVGIGAAAKAPSKKMANYLQATLSDYEGVYAAYYFRMVLNGQPLDPVLGVHFMEGADLEYIDQVMRDLVKRMEEGPSGESPLRFFPLNGNILETVQAKIEPLFVRE